MNYSYIHKSQLLLFLRWRFGSSGIVMQVVGDASKAMWSFKTLGTRKLRAQWRGITVQMTGIFSNAAVGTSSLATVHGYLKFLYQKYRHVYRSKDMSTEVQTCLQKYRHVYPHECLRSLKCNLLVLSSWDWGNRDQLRMPLQTCPLGEVRRIIEEHRENTQQIKASFHLLACFLQQADDITMPCMCAWVKGLSPLLAYFLQQANDITMLCMPWAWAKACLHLLAYFLQQANDITMLCMPWTWAKACLHLLAYFLQQANDITMLCMP
jgi:hypothetical protein